MAADDVTDGGAPVGDLAALLRAHGPLAPATAVDVVAQVAGALHSAHLEGRVHSGLRPRHVLLDEPLAPGEVPPDDLGVHLDGLVDATDDPAGPSDDVRDTGRLLWACLTGWEHEDEAPVPRVEGSDAFTRGLNWVLARSTAADPAKRHADAAALRADLLTLLGGRGRSAAVPDAVVPVTGPPTPDGTDPTDGTDGTGGTDDASVAAPRDEPRSRRRRVSLVALPVVAVLLVVGMVAAVGALTGDDGPPSSARGDGVPSDRPSATDGPTSGSGPGRVTNDVNGDGGGDLVLVERSDGRPATLATYGSTTERLRRLDERELGDAPVPIVGDLDGDGVSEVTTYRVDGGSLVLDGLAGAVTVADVGARPTPVVGDYDGDGTDDLAFLVAPTGGGPGAEVRVAVGADGPERSARAWAADDGWDAETDLVVPGDLDGDGDDDLVLVTRSPADGTVALTALLADGGSFAPTRPTEPTDGAPEDVFRVADLDGDGRDEALVVTPAGGGEVRGLRLDGDVLVEGDLVGSLPGSGADTVLSVGVADLDGDGTDALALVRDPAGTGTTRLEVVRSTGESLVPVAGVDLEPDPGRADVTIADGSVQQPLPPDAG